MFHFNSFVRSVHISTLIFCWYFLTLFALFSFLVIWHLFVILLPRHTTPLNFLPSLTAVVWQWKQGPHEKLFLFNFLSLLSCVLDILFGCYSDKLTLTSWKGFTSLVQFVCKHWQPNISWEYSCQFLFNRCRIYQHLWKKLRGNLFLIYRILKQIIVILIHKDNNIWAHR